MPEAAELTSAIGELDDGYLRVMLLLAVRRARTEDPRRSGFWHALAVALAQEQEKRRSAAAIGQAGANPDRDAVAAKADLETVIEELRMEIASLESEMRESTGDMELAGD